MRRLNFSQKVNIFYIKSVDIYAFIVYNINIILQKRSGCMTREFVFTKSFLNCWRAMGLSDDDLKQLENVLLTNPQIGDVIQGTGGARKLRIRLNNCGKSGGGRVIYLDVFETEKLYLLFAYPKSIQENLTPEQILSIKKIIEFIKKEK